METTNKRNEAAAIIACVGEFRCADCPAKGKCSGRDIKPCEEALSIAIDLLEKNNAQLS